MTAFTRLVLVGGALGALLAAAGCRSDSANGPDTSDGGAEPDSGAAAIISEPVPDSAVARRLGWTAAAPRSASAIGPEVSYVSLTPGTVPDGELAQVRNRRTGSLLTVPVTDGGFDPVPVSAVPGDSVVIEVSRTGAPPVVFNRPVPRSRPPRVVRTYPPRGKTSLPVNMRAEIVFSEPVARTSLAGAVSLRLDATVIPATVRLLDGTTSTAVLEPSQSLQPNTRYTLSVGRGVRDIGGSRLASADTSSFVTGTEVENGVYIVNVTPGAAALASGTQLQLLAATYDSLSREVHGRVVTWTTDDPSVARISASGLVTAAAPGRTHVHATCESGTATVEIDVSATLAPVASVTIAPDSLDVPVGGLVRLTAVARDSAGDTLRFRPITWAAADPGIVALPQGQGAEIIVRGVATGATTVSAAVEGVTARATIRVQAPGYPYASISAGAYATCGITEAGWGMCWGMNAAGQLGIGVTDPYLPTLTPTPMAGGIRFTTIAAGEYHSCGIARDQTAWCWGYPGQGRMGIGHEALLRLCPPNVLLLCLSSWPLPVAGSHHFSSIGVSDFFSEFTCALAMDGAAWCWGVNGRGELGIGSTSGPDACDGSICAETPQPVTGGLAFSQLGVGGSFACGLTTAGRAYCWGENRFGALGDGTTTNRSAPVAVAGGLTFASLTTGAMHTCAIATDGVGYCWGDDRSGELGAVTDSLSAVPVPVAAGTLRWRSLTAGFGFTCGIAESGDAYCWGNNGAGQLGTGSTASSQVAPVRIAGGLQFASLSAGQQHACGLTTDGVAWCWGTHFMTGSGQETDSRVPVRVAGQP